MIVLSSIAKAAIGQAPPLPPVVARKLVDVLMAVLSVNKLYWKREFQGWGNKTNNRNPNWTMEDILCDFVFPKQHCWIFTHQIWFVFHSSIFSSPKYFVNPSVNPFVLLTILSRILLILLLWKSFVNSHHPRPTSYHAYVALWIAHSGSRRTGGLEDT